MPKFEFVGQSAKNATFLQGGPSRLLNLYREPMVGEGVFALLPVMGIEPFAQPSSLYVRAMCAVNDYLYAVIGDDLHRMDASGGLAVIPGMTGTVDACLSSNNGVLVGCASGKYFTSDGAAVYPASMGALLSCGSVTFLGGYTILSELNGKLLQWSDIADPGTMPGLNFGSADSSEGNIVQAFATGGLLWLFKETTSEIWSATGLPGAEAFGRIAGGDKIEVGLKAFGLVAKFTGGAFFIGHDGRVHLAVETQTRPISIPAVETAIATDKVVSCMAYEDKGHTFLCVNFANGPSWCFDLAIGEWHERADADGSAWSVVETVFFKGRWFAGMKSGAIGRFARIATDMGQPILRKAISHTVDFGMARKSLAELEFYGAAGDGGSLQFRLSADRGKTWGKERFISFGPVGEYDRRSVVKRLGLFRHVTMEVVLPGTEPTPILATCNAEVT